MPGENLLGRRRRTMGPTCHLFYQNPVHLVSGQDADPMKNNKNMLERISLLDRLSIQDIEHFGRPLKDHLVGTHDLLERWGCSEDVCLAGLFQII